MYRPASVVVLPFLTRILEVTDPFLLLGIGRNDRIAFC
jgi:hypothetical protein